MLEVVSRDSTEGSEEERGKERESEMKKAWSPSGEGRWSAIGKAGKKVGQLESVGGSPTSRQREITFSIFARSLREQTRRRQLFLERSLDF